MTDLINFSREEADTFLSEAREIRQKALDQGIQRLSTPELCQLAVYNQGITITENGETKRGCDPYPEIYRLICAEIAERMIHQSADRTRPVEENQGKFFDAVKDDVTTMLKDKCEKNLENCEKLKNYYKGDWFSERNNKLKEVGNLIKELKFGLDHQKGGKDRDSIDSYAETLEIFNNLLKSSTCLTQDSDPIVTGILKTLFDTIITFIGLTTYTAAEQARRSLINENRYEPLLAIPVIYNEKQFKEQLAEIRRGKLGLSTEPLENLKDNLLQDLGKLVEKCDPDGKESIKQMQRLAEPIVKKIGKVDTLLKDKDYLVGGYDEKPKLSANQEQLIALGNIGANFMIDNDKKSFKEARNKILRPTEHTTSHRPQKPN